MLGEGGTPLIELPRLGAELGLKALHAKLELCNPTGSYKDRIAARTMEAALDQGRRGWIATSSGNAGTSFAAFGRRAGLPGILCVPYSITREKLLPPLVLGARVVLVEGVGDGGDRESERRLFEIVEGAAVAHDLFLGITAHRFNDVGMRAVDAIAHEIVDVGAAPDLAYVPTGGGGLVAGIARGFADRGAHSAVVAAQPAGCGPIARYLAGELARPAVARNESSISALQLPGPPDGELACHLIRATGGHGVLASDDEILAAQRRLARTEGVFVEPAAACGLAGLEADVRAGRAGAETSALLILTGSGLKDLATVERGVERGPSVGLDMLGDVIGGLARA